MRGSNRINRYVYSILLIVTLAFTAGCSQKVEPITVYAGKGLKHAIEEIKQNFEQQEGIPLSITYAGSQTLLNTLQNTHKGDIFIPGSKSYIKKATKLSIVTSEQYVAKHVPAFIVSASASKYIKTYSDLLNPGVKIAMGNKDMAAIGKVGEAILKDAKPENNFRSNIVVTGSTVNELLNLVVDEEVDAALTWNDMLKWNEAKELGHIVIPTKMNKIKEIWVATLSTSSNHKQAKHFANFVATEGRSIFLKHGFGE